MVPDYLYVIVCSIYTCVFVCFFVPRKNKKLQTSEHNTSDKQACLHTFYNRAIMRTVGSVAAPPRRNFAWQPHYRILKYLGILKKKRTIKKFYAT